MNGKILLSAAALAASACAASAAGYQIIEQGAANLGAGMAGASANAGNDASTAFWNPSAAVSMDLQAGETRVDSAVFAVIPKLCLAIDPNSSAPTPFGGNFDGNCATNSIVPQFFLVHRFSEDVYGTLSITAPWGLESDYAGDWIGNTSALRSYLFTADFNPSIVYRVNDWLSVSGGVSAQFAYCTLSQILPVFFPGQKFDMTGQDWSIGGNVGFTIKYAEDGRIGFQWRSAVEHTLDGNAHLNGSTILAPISADMHMPHVFTVGAYQRLRGDFREFAVMAEYAYTMWSAFDNLTVNGLPFAVRVEEDWKDTSRISLGFHYYPDYIENLTLRLGSCFDESPVKSPQHRTERIPCADRVWLSTGVGYTYGNISIDLAYTYIFVIGNTDIDTMPNVKGEYFAHIHVIGLQLGLKF